MSPMKQPFLCPSKLTHTQTQKHTHVSMSLRWFFAFIWLFIRCSALWVLGTSKHIWIFDYFSHVYGMLSALIFTLFRVFFLFFFLLYLFSHWSEFVSCFFHFHIPISSTIDGWLFKIQNLVVVLCEWYLWFSSIFSLIIRIDNNNSLNSSNLASKCYLNSMSNTCDFAIYMW